MNSVEQTQNPMPDDGSMVPKESGKTGENLQTGSDAESREDAKSEWEQIIHSPRFHALYTEHISEIVRKRLKSERASSELLERAAGLLGLDDPVQLPAKISELLTPVQRDWQSEEAAVREKYPEFDLQRDSQSPFFAKLLQGFAASPEITLTNLYELSHLDSLKASAAKDAAAETASQLLGAVQLRHARPHENGLDTAAAFGAGRAAHLTRAQRAVLAERAAKGEHITF